MKSAYVILSSKPQEKVHLGVWSVDTKFCRHRQQILHHIHINLQPPVCRSLILNRSSMVFQSLKTNTGTAAQIMSQPLSATLFAIHYFLIILSFNTTFIHSFIHSFIHFTFHWSYTDVEPVMYTFSIINVTSVHSA